MSGHVILANSPICPWCGEDVDDTPAEMPSFEGVSAVECECCGKPVIVHQTVTIEYRVEKDQT